MLKCIDYIFGANEDPKIVKEEIHGYVLDAVVKFNGENYSIRRTLGNSEEIFVNENLYPLTDYKLFFNIKRGMYGKQFIINKKANEISYRTNPSKDDVLNYLDLLKLTEIIKSIQEIYESQDRIKEYKKNKQDLISFYGDFDIKQIDEEIYFVEKEVKRLTKELNNVSQKIKNIEVSEIQINIVEEYAAKSEKLKRVKRTFESNKLECERLDDFINSSNKLDISSEHIIAIYEKAKQEVPDMVRKTVQEVEIFHHKVFDERKEFLANKKLALGQELSKLQDQILTLSVDVNKLGKIISTNQVYQESIELYEKYNSDLQDLKYKEGKLSQVKNIDDMIKTEDSNLTTNFDVANRILDDYKTLTKSYRDFIYNITKAIYDEEVYSFFNIKIRPKNQKNRPVIFEINLKGDTGEGVNEVKKNLVDYLVFKYNDYMDLFIQDSACYNGIDPRQVSGMLKQVGEIAKQTNKQAIIAINKYQLGNYEEVIKFVKQNSILNLSEKDKLFDFDF